ncbi:(Fe-S)-binding protein [Candidatus Foliamicus sp.]
MTDTDATSGSVERLIDWRSPDYYDETALVAEEERVFDICHGCRRCFNLCNAFPLLFDAIDESDSGELDTTPKKVYWEVAEQCYLCDMCYRAKCPYVPPHPFMVDFPRLMLRAKAQNWRKNGARLRDRTLAAPRAVGRLAGIPVVAQTVNALNRNSLARAALENVAGVSRRAPLPDYRKFKGRRARSRKQGEVLVFATCYGDYNGPEIIDDLFAVLDHNGISATMMQSEACCGMPKLELGDFQGVEALLRKNLPALAEHARGGGTILAPVPSCALMFQQELPEMFPEDEHVRTVAESVRDPMHYLWLRNREGELAGAFKQGLGRVMYHAPCHTQVQNFGLKTPEVLKLAPDTTVQTIERCSGFDGVYGVRAESRDASEKIARAAIRSAQDSEWDHFTSDCPLAGRQILNGLQRSADYRHPVSLLRQAYGC